MGSSFGSAGREPTRRHITRLLRQEALRAAGLTAGLAAVLTLQLSLPAPSAPAQEPNQPTERTPAERLDAAATAFASAASADGVNFTVVQLATLHARPGGPLIEIPHPTDRYRSLGYAAEYYVGGSIAAGAVSAEGFWLQMREGPLREGVAPDFEAAPLTWAALTRDGKTWRNDRDRGWYETEQPPGIGLDVATVALLPRLLREATDAALDGTKDVTGRSADVVRATGKVANVPGLLATDGARFTELAEPLRFALDAEGRLIEIAAVVRNTNQDVFDLLVEVTITFDYSGAVTIRQPLPLAPPPAPPSDEDE